MASQNAIPSREHHTRSVRPLALTLIAFAIPTYITLMPFTITGLDTWGQRVLAVVLASLLLWISESLPIEATSLAVVAMLALTAPGPNGIATQQALVGFTNPAPFFLLGALAFGSATTKSGLAQRVAGIVVSSAQGSSKRLYIQMVMMMPTMALLVPSSLTRTVMTIPVYEEVFHRHGIKQAERLPRLILLATALLQILASTAILTGGAAPIVTSALLGGISWARWFFFMAVPVYVIFLLFAAVLFLVHRPEPLSPVMDKQNGVSQYSISPTSGSVTPVEYRVLIIIALTSVLWLTDFVHHLNPAIPALIGAVALFLPVVGTLSWKDYEEGSPWSIFLLIGSSLSLAAALQKSGATEWLATTLIASFPFDQLPLIPLILSFILIVAIANVFLPNPPSVLSVMIPVMTAFAIPLGLNPLVVGLIVLIVVQTTVFYPVQIGTALVTYRTGHYTKGELFQAGLILWGISTIALLGVALAWWGLLGEPIRQ